MKAKISTFIIECLRTDVIDELDALLWEYGKFMKGVYEIIPNSNIVNGKIIETVISDVMIDYHKNIDYEKHSVRYHFCTMDKHSFDEFSERELEDMIRRGLVLCIE